uniref:Uncharacterized protein n=1 Tax=Steinernema glaseri TaxID=37863 RepID=A0A1I8AHG4_9BILA
MIPIKVLMETKNAILKTTSWTNKASIALAKELLAKLINLFPIPCQNLSQNFEALVVFVFLLEKQQSFPEVSEVLHRSHPV